MSIIETLQAIVMGLVEGLTEFLPVSSTGHLIIASNVVGMPQGPATDTFIVAIQAGAILAVCWYYRRRIIDVCLGLFKKGPEQNLAVNTVAAFLPAAFFGALLAGYLKTYLFNPLTVALALIVGGFIIFWVERRAAAHPETARVPTMDDLTLRDAVGVGFCQCLAMIPGTSRSGATIIGGMLLGLSRRAATEFSFFLAIPTIFGATVWDLWNSGSDLLAIQPMMFTVGLVVSFFSALVVVHWLIRFVARNSFTGFGWYRIFFGLLILGLSYGGYLPGF